MAPVSFSALATHVLIRSIRTSILFMVSARRQKAQPALAGIILAAAPPLVTIPLILSWGSNVGRIMSIWLNTLITALSALIPFCGAEEWAPFPVKSTLTVHAARPPRPTRLEPPPEGCIIKAKSTSSKAPLARSFTFPAPPSSAGVPMMEIRPGSSFIKGASPRNAPTEQVAIRLWPHPWPIPFKASYSARNATVGPSPLPQRSARKDVSRPP